MSLGPYVVLKCHLHFPKEESLGSRSGTVDKKLTDDVQPVDTTEISHTSPKPKFSSPEGDSSVLFTSVSTDLIGAEESHEVELLVDNSKNSDLLSKWVNHIKIQLYRRGFHVATVFHEGDTHCFLVSLVRKRFQLQDALGENKGLSYIMEDGTYRYRLAQDALDIIKRCVDVNFELKSSKELSVYEQKWKRPWDIWIAHDHEEYNKYPMDTPTRVKNYYGPKIGIYCCFVNYYTLSLGLLSIIGILVFYEQILYSDRVGSTDLINNPDINSIPNISVDSPYIPSFSIIQALWATLFLALWRKRESMILHDWDEKENFSASATWYILANTNNSKRGVERRSRLVFSYFITYLYNAAALYFIYKTFIWEEYLKTQDTPLSFQGYEIPFSQMLPLIIRIAFPAIMDPISSRLFKWCTKLECHRFKGTENDQFVIKKFIFAAFTTYSTLWYITFIKQDLQELRSNLIATLTIGAAVGNLIELWQIIHSFLFKCIVNLFKSRGADSDNALSNQNEKLLKDELLRGDFNIDEEYMQLALQYGFISMFSIAFPLAPLCVFVSNLIHSKLDISRFFTSKRYQLQFNRSRIGIWQSIFDYISFASIITNVFILCFVTSNLDTYIPHHINIDMINVHLDLDREFVLSFSGRLIILVALEHFLVFLKFLLRYILVSKNDSNNKTIGQERHGIQTKFKIEMPSDISGSGKNDDGNNDNSTKDVNNGKSTVQSTKVQNGQHVLEFIPPKAGFHVTPFFSDPIVFVSGFVIAPILSHLQLPMLYYVPCVLFLAHLLSSRKAFDVRRKAVSLSVEEDVVQELLEGKLPSWVDRSCFERVSWLNSALRKLWPFLGAGISDIILQNVNPILNKVTQDAAALGYLQILALSFGPVAPTLNSVYFDRTHESLVRIDIDITWVSEMFTILQCKLLSKTVLSPMIDVEVKDLSLQGTLRIELKQLAKCVAGFKILSISFVKTPQLDMTLKLQSMDIASLGFGKNFNVAALVESIIKGIIKDLMTYPNAIEISLGTNEVSSSSAVPVGLLGVKVCNAVDVKAANFMGKSDPYVKLDVSSLPGVQTTSVIADTLNPVWHENFEFLIFDVVNDYIDIEVLDRNYTRAHESLGFTSMKLEDVCGKQQTLELFLYETLDCAKGCCKKHLNSNVCRSCGKGTLKVITSYIGLSQGNIAEIDATMNDSELSTYLSRTTPIEKVEYPLDVIDDFNNQAAFHQQLANAGEYVNDQSLNLSFIKDTKIGVISISKIRCMNMNPSEHGDRQLFVQCELEYPGFKRPIILEKQKRTITALKGREAIFDEMFHFIVHNLKFSKMSTAETASFVPIAFQQINADGAKAYLQQTEESPINLLISVYDDRKSLVSSSTLLGRFRYKLGDLVTHKDSYLSRLFPCEELQDYDIADNNTGPGTRQISFKAEWRLAKTKINSR